MKQPVVLVSLDKDLLDILQNSSEFEPIGLLDPDPAAGSAACPHLGDDSDWPALVSRRPDVRVVLAVDPPALKARLAAHYGADRLAGVRAPDAYAAASAVLGPGVLLQRGVKVLPDARLGMACKLNVNATVHHDCRVGDCCTLAPGSMLLGGVELGDRVYLGAGAIVLPGRRVGAGATVGAGAVVSRDVASGATVVGMPARARGAG